jgi:hypothetical protein
LRRPDASSRQIGRPAGVTDSFQVSKYSIDPSGFTSERTRFNELVSGAIGCGEITPLNRGSESSFKARSDNF